MRHLFWPAVKALNTQGQGKLPGGRLHVLSEAADTEPRFTGPWTDWRRHGSILLSDGRGERRHTGVAVFDELPRSVFASSAPAALPLPSE